ncbi:MAG: CaiB/BaiF CoA transferase family protein [Chloroflexota bacterium]
MTTAFPLAGLRVVAFEQAVAGPLATRHLADAGAEIIKIERPEGGDFGRHYDTSVNGQSAYFVWLNRGKRSLAIDLKAPGADEITRRLVDSADVVLQNLAPGALDRLGFGYKAVRAKKPGVIYCNISGYGQDGPYRDKKAFDLLLQGESGLISVTGTPDFSAKVGISVCDISAGMYAFSTILLALRTRDLTGQGDVIDISMLESMADWMSPFAYFYTFADRKLPRAGMRHNVIVPYGVYKCGDGLLVNMAVENPRQWARLCEVVLERPDLVNDPRFNANEKRVQNRSELEPLIEAQLGRLTQTDAIDLLERADIPNGRVNDVEALARHEQLAARGRWHEFESEVGPLTLLGHPMNLASMPQRTDRIPALGEDSEAIVSELGFSADEVQALRVRGVIGAREGSHAEP